MYAWLEEAGLITGSEEWKEKQEEKHGRAGARSGERRHHNAGGKLYAEGRSTTAQKKETGGIGCGCSKGSGNRNRIL